MRLVAFGGLGMLEIFEKIAAQWATVMQNPAVLVPIFTLGFGVGCAVAWLILNQRLKHHRDVIGDLRAKLGDDATKAKDIPKVKIWADTLTQPKGAVGKALRAIRVVVENMSALHVRNCSLREAVFTSRSGKSSGMQRYFRLAEEGYADMSAHTFKRTFDLRGLGDRQAVEIAFLDETQAETPVVMLYATDPTALTRNAIPRSLFPHTLTVSFTADALGSLHRILEMIAH